MTWRLDLRGASAPDDGPMTLSTSIVQSAEFDDALIDEAFALYRRYYTPTDAAVFEADMRAKSFALLIRDGERLVGFSTAEKIAPEPAFRVLYSGDTIIDRAYWGSQVLSYAWLRAAGQIWAEQPTCPLYWMLITKGHRTYRYLPAFSKAYYPSPDWDTPMDMQALIDRLGALKFGARYDPQTGTIRADPALPTRVAEEALGAKRSRYADYFAARNPGHREGDELVTLCQLAPETLSPRARRQFLDTPA